MAEPELNLREVATDELRWELIRRADERDRKVLLYFPAGDLRDELRSRGELPDAGSRRDERRVALLFLGAITIGLIAVLAAMSVANKELPDALVGLSGTSLGAIAGILVGKPTDGAGEAAPARTAGSDPG
jgi:hypothetical protein